MGNVVTYRLWAPRALFTDPVSKIGGEKFSYPIPTYQALKGITESIYWKPTIVWYIDRVRVVNPIRNESVNVRTMKSDGKPDLSIYTYLADVEYRVQAHFEWDDGRADLEGDRNESKHFCQMERAIEKGGRRDIFLGTRECQGYVGPCSFDEGAGAYDGLDSMPFGLMFHGFDYPERNHGVFSARFWTPIMAKGIVDFPRPEDCRVRKRIRGPESDAAGARTAGGSRWAGCRPSSRSTTDAQAIRRSSVRRPLCFRCAI